VTGRNAAYIVGFALCVVILGVTLATVDLATVGAALSRADYRLLPLMIAFSVIGLATRAARWHGLIQGRIRFWACFHISNIGYLFNNLLPLRAGEIARVLLAAGAPQPVPMMTTLSTVLLERIVDLLFVLGLLGAAVAVLPATNTIHNFSVGGAALILAAIGGIAFLGIGAYRRTWLLAAVRWVQRQVPFTQRLPLEAQLDKFLDGLAALKTPSALLLLLFWTIASWVSSIAATYVLLVAFFGTADWGLVILFMALSSLTVSASAVVAYTPAGVGPYHASVVLALAIIGYTQPEGAPVAFAIVLHLVNLAIYLVLGMIGLTQQHIRPRDLLERVRDFAKRPLAPLPKA